MWLAAGIIRKRVGMPPAMNRAINVHFMIAFKNPPLAAPLPQFLPEVQVPYHRKDSSVCRGFTLVELLVVIGIIALLISVLMPALAAARRSAQLLKCSAQLRTLGQAMLMHAQDHRGCFPLAGNINPAAGSSCHPQDLGDGSMQKYDYFSNDGGGANIVPTAFPEAFAPYLGVEVVSDGWWNADPAMLTGVLRDAFQCPSDEYTAMQSNWQSTRDGSRTRRATICRGGRAMVSTQNSLGGGPGRV